MDIKRWAPGRSSSRADEWRTIAGSSLFNAKFYAEELARAGTKLERTSQKDLVQHYLLEGFQKSIDPHPLFQIDYYYSQVPGLKEEEREPIMHFLSEGADKNISPCRLFDISYYCKQVPESELGDANPLVHFITRGAFDLLDPHPLFDTQYYDQKDPRIRQSRVDPLSHFRGQIFDYPRHAPNPLFDCEYYFDRYPECKEERIDPLSHFIERGVHRRHYVSKRHEDVMRGILKTPDSRLARGQSNTPCVFITSHDATRTGAPLIILRIVELLCQEHGFECVVFLGAGGALKEDFQKVAAVVDLDEIRIHRKLHHSAVRLLVHSLLYAKPAFGICNSAGSWPLMDAFFHLGIPFISLIHEFPDWYPDLLFRRISEQARIAVYPASVVLASAERKNGQKFENAVVLPQGIPYAEFPIGQREEEIVKVRDELGLPEDTILVLGCGEVSQRKGCDLFLSAAAMVRRQRPDSHIAFLWVGNSDPLQMRPNGISPIQFWLDGDLERAGLEDTVFFVGERARPDRYFLAADIFVMSSRLDPFPCVVLEAMAAGLPVICFDRGTGAKEVICERDRLAVPYLGMEALGQKILELIDDEDFRRDTGEANKLRVEKDYNFPKYVSSLLRICEQSGLCKPHDRPAKVVGWSNRKKLLIPCSDWSNSGVSSVVEVLGQGLGQYGWDVELIMTGPRSRGGATGQSDEDLGPCLPTRRIEPTEASIVGLWEALMADFEDNAPCIILATDDYLSSAVTPALSDRIGVVGWVQSDDSACFEHAYRLGRYWNAIVCETEAWGERIRDLNPAFADKIQVIPSSTVSKGDIKRRKTVRRAAEIRLIYCGQLVQEQQRVLDLRDLVKCLEARNVPFTLTLVGDDPDGSALWRLKTAWFRQLVDGRIRIAGKLPRQEVLQEFLENDVLVLLSESEGMPLSLMEAMATGCVPVVAKLEEGSPTLIQDGVNGFVIQGRDYRDWADAIERLWKDSSLRSELSKNAQHTIARDFTAEKSVKMFDEVLCDVLRDITSGQYERLPTLRARSGYGDILPPPEISQSKLPWES